MNIRFPVLARKTHKWLGLLLGLQVVIWSLTGVYMTVIHIDTIHGDHLVRPAASPAIDPKRLTDPLALAARNSIGELRLAWLLGRPIYVAKGPAGERAFSALSGKPLPLLDEQAARSAARAIYTGNQAIVSAELIQTVPLEIKAQKPPLWRIEFDHWNKPTFYLSPVTGELVSRRHELWRIFDFMWMLHIMEYEERENVNNLLLRVFTIGAVLAALSGGWLLFYAFPKRKKAKKKDRAR